MLGEGDPGALTWVWTKGLVREQVDSSAASRVGSCGWGTGKGRGIKWTSVFVGKEKRQ